MATPHATARAVVDALGAAWTVFTLYPDPERQPAFSRAVEHLQMSIARPITLEVHPHGFAYEGAEVETEREGVERLARRAFLQNIEIVRIEEPPPVRELIAFFAVLAEDEEDVAQGGGVGPALMRAGVGTIAVIERTPLDAAVEDEIPERHPTVARVIEEGADPEAFAAALVEEAAGDPDTLAELYVTRYREVLDKVAPEDVAGREEVVKAFVEAFFYLDDRSQLAVFERFLEGSEAEDLRLFLDQFAGHELVRMAPHLDARGLSLLLDYARIGTDDADKRPDELLALLDNPEAIDTAREVVAAAVQDKLGRGAAEPAGASPRLTALDRLRRQYPDRRRFFYDALEVFRGLLHVEQRDDRFSRLMRIWAGKVAAAARQGRFRRAELWLRAVLDNPTYPDHRHDEVTETIRQMVASETIDPIVTAAARGDDKAVRVLGLLGGHATDELIDRLADEEDATRRRALIELLGQLAALDPSPVIDRLSDERWYVVRNLVAVLARSGRPEAREAVRPLLRHDDHRVRVEALRALAALGEPNLSRHLEQALADRHESVRLAAVGMLAVRDDPVAEQVLIAALRDGRLGAEESRRALRALARSPRAEARAVVAELAEQRFVLFSPQRRALREAAREALKGVAS